jgi:ABC-2 type transport system ATP-binding protein
MARSAAAIEADGLRKVYEHSRTGPKTALDGVSLSVPEGSFFALLGPNGAGKSTFINIMAGLVNPTSGSAKVAGYDVVKDYRQARALLGVVPQELVLDPFFPVYEALEYTAGYYGVPKKKRRTAEIIEAVGLSDKAFTPARRLSGGMRRRLLVAKALVHSPRVLILDEPTAGVDVDLRAKLWEYVRELHRQGTTVVLTTHYLEEAQELCDRVAIIHRGRLIANDSKRALMDALGTKCVTVTAQTPFLDIPAAAAALSLRARILPAGALELEYDKTRHTFGDVLAALLGAGVVIQDVAVGEPDLEDVFLRLTNAAA